MTLSQNQQPERSGKSRLIVLKDSQRTEKETISNLRKKLECILNQWAMSQTIHNIVDDIRIQLENLGLSKEEISEIG